MTDLFSIAFIEWVGYAGSIIVAVSLTMSSIKKLRWYNLTGAAVFSFYGFSIGSLPVGFLNLFIAITDVYYIIKMFSAKEAYTSVLVSPASKYLEYFLSFHEQEIRKYFPDFNAGIFSDEAEKNKLFPLLLLRNADVAGVFIGSVNNNILYIHLDFVTAPFRDLKPGKYLYFKNLDFLKSHGIQKIVCRNKNSQHHKYLLKMGFVPESTGMNVMTKEIK